MTIICCVGWQLFYFCEQSFKYNEMSPDLSGRIPSVTIKNKRFKTDETKPISGSGSNRTGSY